MRRKIQNLVVTEKTPTHQELDRVIFSVQQGQQELDNIQISIVESKNQLKQLESEKGKILSSIDIAKKTLADLDILIDQRNETLSNISSEIKSVKKDLIDIQGSYRLAGENLQKYLDELRLKQRHAERELIRIKKTTDGIVEDHEVIVQKLEHDKEVIDSHVAKTQNEILVKNQESILLQDAIIAANKKLDDIQHLIVAAEEIVHKKENDIAKLNGDIDATRKIHTNIAAEVEVLKQDILTAKETLEGLVGKIMEVTKRENAVKKLAESVKTLYEKAGVKVNI